MNEQSASNIIYTSSKPRMNNLVLIIIGIILLIIISASAFWLGQNYSKPTSNDSTPSNQVSISSAKATSNPLFQNQTAVINGKITKSAKGQLTIEDNDKDTSSFNLAPKIVIYKQVPGQTSAQTTTNESAIELNKQAVITLSVIDGEYKVSSIAYLSPPPPPAN